MRDLQSKRENHLQAKVGRTQMCALHNRWHSVCQENACAREQCQGGCGADLALANFILVLRECRNIGKLLKNRRVNNVIKSLLAFSLVEITAIITVLYHLYRFCAVVIITVLSFTYVFKNRAGKLVRTEKVLMYIFFSGVFSHFKVGFCWWSWIAPKHCPWGISKRFPVSIIINAIPLERGELDTTCHWLLLFRSDFEQPQKHHYQASILSRIYRFYKFCDFTK